MEENQQNPADLQQAAPIPAPAEKEIILEEEPKTGGIFSVKTWLSLLTLVFTLSMLSGLYIIFRSNTCTAETEVIEEENHPSAAAAAIMKIASRGEEGAALIRIRGVIQEGSEAGFSARQSASAIAKRIRALADKREVKALLLDINSPGGTVGATQDIYDAVLYFKSKSKPVVAMFRDVGASGAFYIAMAADKVIAQPGTMTGSIGVILQTTNFEGLFDKIGVRFIPIKSGKHKDIGAFYRPMTDEETALLQEMISDTYQQFYDAVKAGRPEMDDSMLKVYADGRILTGSRAKAIGLIDDLGGEDKAREYLSKLTNTPDIKILTPRINDFFDMLSLSASGLDGKTALNNKVEELSTPKVSYLWTF